MELYLSRVLAKSTDAENTDEQWIRFPSIIGEEISIGRSADVSVRLLSAHVSRKHASIKKMDGEFFINDQNSLNGIHINDKKIETAVWHRLHTKDKVEIGRPDDDEILKTMNIDDRFVYLILEAYCASVDTKPAGPKQHISASMKKMLKTRPQKKIPPKLKNKIETITCQHITKDDSKVLFQDKPTSSNKQKIGAEKKKIETLLETNDVMEQENKRLKLQLEQKDLALKEEIDLRNKKELTCRESNEIEILPNVNDGMERENKRLKLELEQKDQALKEEIHLRNKKLEEEHQKITTELEENFKNKLEQKEEELEMRLQLEKDIAIEQCKATIEKEEISSVTKELVVNAMENELQCSICAELFIVSTTLNCAHTFCEYCIKQWMTVKYICPVCRQPIQTTTRSLVLDNYIDKVIQSLSGEFKDNRIKMVEERKKIVAQKPTPYKSGCGQTIHGRGQQSFTRGRGRNGSGGYSRGASTNSSSSSRSEHYGVRTRSSVIVLSDEESSGNDSGDMDSNDSSNYSEEGYYHDGYNDWYFHQ